MDGPGPLIAKGRAADVYEYGAHHVLRRYRTPHDASHEAAVMRHVREHGYPCPEVTEVSGGDMVMERVDGPTMLSVFSKRPWKLFEYASIIARLLRQLHELPTPGWLERKMETGDSFVHMDLHPDNVLLTRDGPVVIDWTNAGLGDPHVEVADLWLIMKAAVVPGNVLERTLIGVGRGFFFSRILRRFDETAVRRALPAAAARRGHDRNMSEVEIARMAALVKAKGLD